MDFIFEPLGKLIGFPASYWIKSAIGYILGITLLWIAYVVGAYLLRAFLIGLIS